MIPAMLRWIHHWWIADRIRFAPGHCRLFQLAVGDRMLVRNRLWVVVERQEAIAEDHVNVQFQLTELDEEHSVIARLSVELQDMNARHPKVSWRGEDWAEELFEEDVVILNDASSFV